MSQDAPMQGYLAFEGRIEPLELSNATYTILRLPDGIAETLSAQGARRVEGEINDHWVNLALSRAPSVDGVFLWAGKSLTDRLGVAPGEALEVRLRKAMDDRVDVPEDVILALRKAGMQEAWDAQTPGKRRGMLYQISTAKRAETRARRIAELVDGLEAADG